MAREDPALSHPSRQRAAAVFLGALLAGCGAGAGIDEAVPKGAPARSYPSLASPAEPAAAQLTDTQRQSSAASLRSLRTTTLSRAPAPPTAASTAELERLAEEAQRPPGDP